MSSGLVVSTAKHTSGAFWQLSQCLASVPQWRASRCDPGLCVNRHYLGQRCVVMQTGTMVCRGYSRHISLSDLVIYSHTMARGRQKDGGLGRAEGDGSELQEANKIKQEEKGASHYSVKIHSVV